MLIAVAIAIAAYAVLEAAWLWAMRGFYGRQLGGKVMRGKPLKVRSVPAAVLVYVLLVAALVYFVLLPCLKGKPWASAARGAFFGATVYGVYNLTNMVTLDGYTWTMVAVDTLWGASLFAAVAALFARIS
jgi:uncharacterized membrane protein